MYLSCGILGATVMPHSIFLGSGVVQPRLRQFDEHSSASRVQESIKAYNASQDLKEKYKPSIHAIRSCLKYSIVELATSLFTFALFVNSAILIVAGSSLYDTDAADADLFGIHDLLVRTIAPAAGVHDGGIWIDSLPSVAGRPAPTSAITPARRRDETFSVRTVSSKRALRWSSMMDSTEVSAASSSGVAVARPL